MEEGTLGAKTTMLMALAISIVVHCEGCIAYHVHDASAAGATRQELLETIGVALLMGVGPSSIYPAHAMDTIEQFQPGWPNIRGNRCVTGSQDWQSLAMTVTHIF